MLSTGNFNATSRPHLMSVARYMIRQAGLQLMELLMEEEVREVVGEGSRRQPDRTANRWGKDVLLHQHEYSVLLIASIARFEHSAVSAEIVTNGRDAVCPQSISFIRLTVK